MSKKNFISGAMDLLHELLVGMLKSNYQTCVSKSREILLEHKDYQDSPDERKRKIYTEASQFHAQRGDVYKSIRDIDAQCDDIKDSIVDKLS